MGEPGSSRARRIAPVGIAAALLLAATIAVVAKIAMDSDPAEPAAPPVAGGERAGVALEGRSGGAKSAADSLRVSIEPPERQIVLALARWPDGERIARAVVELSFDGSPATPDATRLSDGAGRLAIQVAGDARSVEVEVLGFETEAVDPTALAAAPAENLLHLRPLSGLFGRVVSENGEPLAGLAVQAVRTFETASVRRHDPGGREPSGRRRAAAEGGGETELTVLLQQRNRSGASATTTADGWYFLEWPTRVASAPIEVVCATRDGRHASLEVELPRGMEALPDMVLPDPDSPSDVLALRVVDEQGQPVAGAHVWGMQKMGQVKNLRSDAQGECRFPEPALPAVIFAGTSSSVLWSTRIDGRELEPGHPVESLDQRVELILREVPSAVFLVVDQETGAPVPTARGSIELLDAAGVRVGRIDLEADAAGRAETVLVPRHVDVRGLEVRSVWGHIGADGYEDHALKLIDATRLAAQSPLVIRLRPLAGFVRGIVLRSGEPAAGLQVSTIGLLPAAGGRLEVESIARCYADDKGRFAMRWAPEDPRALVALRPHWTNFAEFGTLGPMPVASALDRQLVLEIEPGLRVPAILRGATRGGRYVLSVSSVREEGVVPITINGAPIEAWRDGEVRTHVFVPSQWPSRLTIGYRTEDAVHFEGSAPVSFDPAAPSLPLVFELPLLFARIEGTVTGVDLARARSLRVIAARGEEGAVVAQPREDGTFVLAELPLGTYELLLVRVIEGARTELLASETLQVGGNQVGLVLRPRSEVGHPGQ